ATYPWCERKHPPRCVLASVGVFMLRNSVFFAAACAGVASFGLISSAQAQSAPPRWGGLYVGVGAGIGNVSHDVGLDLFNHTKIEKRECEYPVPAIAAIDSTESSASIVQNFACQGGNWSPWKTVKEFGPYTTHSQNSADTWDPFATAQIGYDQVVSKYM